VKGIAKHAFAAVILVSCFAATTMADPVAFQKALIAYAAGDFATALRLFRPLADRGDGEAQDYLGYMYENGWGVPQDYVTAHMWHNLAASHGIQNAAEKRNSLSKKMTPAQIAEAQKLAREWKPN
jgi:TPR repeat protein